jgi:hypothetical protein
MTSSGIELATFQLVAPTTIPRAFYMITFTNKKYISLYANNNNTFFMTLITATKQPEELEHENVPKTRL